MSESPTIIHGDCLAELRKMTDSSIDAIVTDPPYGLSQTRPDKVADTITRWATGERDYTPGGKGFMGKAWDSFVPPPVVWDECMRVLKPGGHLLVFAGTRTQDLMGLSIRLAGFELRDSLAWIYGSGFPKSMDVGKAIESTLTTGKSDSRSLRQTEQAGNGEAYTLTGKNNGIMGETRTYERKEFAPATDEANSWSGWGTALKPGQEPIIMARKPLDGTVAANVLAHGTGGINVDSCRIPTTDKLSGGHASGGQQMDQGWHRPWMDDPEKVAENAARSRESVARSEKLGRWPTNVLLDPEAAAAMDEQSGILKSGAVKEHHKRSTVGGNGLTHGAMEGVTGPLSEANEGGASRFFPVFKYQAKAPAKERPSHTIEDGTEVKHPTVKPLELMRWLVRLVTPPGGIVLDPFSGSGTTLEAALMEGFTPVGIEAESDYIPLIEARLSRVGDTLEATL